MAIYMVLTSQHSLWRPLTFWQSANITVIKSKVFDNSTKIEKEWLSTLKKNNRIDTELVRRPKKKDKEKEKIELPIKLYLQAAKPTELIRSYTDNYKEILKLEGLTDHYLLFLEKIEKRVIKKKNHYKDDTSTTELYRVAFYEELKEDK